jgi:DNA-binding FadR family transcriptional regulator
MSTLEVVSSKRLYRIIADQIEEKIRAAEFAPGARLPPERDLAEQLNVARSTVREALIALELRGLVEVRIGSGVFVLSQVPAVVAPAGSAEQPPSQSTGSAVEASPFEILEARMLVEPEVAALAAQHATPEQIAAIELAHKHLEGDGSPYDSDFDAHRAFHEAIARACGNAALASLVAHAWDLSEASPLFRRLDEHFVTQSVWDAATDEHERILAAIVAGDAVKARHAMSYHLLGITARLSEDLLKPAVAPTAALRRRSSTVGTRDSQPSAKAGGAS